MPIPAEVIGRVGRSYFFQRFRTEAGQTAEDEWIRDLPLRHPSAPQVTGGDASLTVGEVRIPLFQPVAEVRGSELWFAHSNGKRNLAGAVRDQAVVLGFNPWVVMGAGILGLNPPGDPTKLQSLRRIPWVDLFASELAAAFSRAGCGLAPRLPWAGNAPFALCLTHDVDRMRKTFQYVTQLGRRRGIRGIAVTERSRGRAYWGFDLIRDLERRAGARSTFFMLQEGPTAKRGLRNRLLAWGLADFENPEIASVVRLLAREGWEIGLHASLSSTTAPQRLMLEKEKLEAIIGARVAGVRQHYLLLRVPDRWEELARAGFEYDASFGYRDGWGFRAGTAFPFALAGRSGVLPLIQVPLHIMDSTLASADDAWAECVRALDQVQSVGGALTILFHQRYFDSRNFPGYADLYEQLIGEARRRGAWIGPIREILRAWET